MSSAAALPLSIKAASSNLSDNANPRNDESCDNAAVIISSTVNVHLVGDCFFIPMVAFVILRIFDVPPPDFGEYLVFSMRFVISKFAVAAVPGGGILVMLPVIESCLNFNQEMLGLITALYVLFDPVITSCNVYGNGAFAMICNRIFSVFDGSRITRSVNRLPIE
jgi:Na+/H+-dicarboxylate symporter